MVKDYCFFIFIWSSVVSRIVMPSCASAGNSNVYVVTSMLQCQGISANFEKSTVLSSSIVLNSVWEQRTYISSVQNILPTFSSGQEGEWRSSSTADPSQGFPKPCISCPWQDGNRSCTEMCRQGSARDQYCLACICTFYSQQRPSQWAPGQRAAVFIFCCNVFLSVMYSQQNYSFMFIGHSLKQVHPV